MHRSKSNEFLHMYQYVIQHNIHFRNCCNIKQTNNRQMISVLEATVSRFCWVYSKANLLPLGISRKSFAPLGYFLGLFIGSVFLCRRHCFGNLLRNLKMRMKRDKAKKHETSHEVKYTFFHQNVHRVGGCSLNRVGTSICVNCRE